jgi:hypothetical protein
LLAAQPLLLQAVVVVGLVQVVAYSQQEAMAVQVAVELVVLAQDQQHLDKVLLVVVVEVAVLPLVVVVEVRVLSV